MIFTNKSGHSYALLPSLAMLALWTESISATLVCTSPTRLTSGIKAGSSLVLGFSDSDILSSTSAITAQLICSANGSVALTLGSGYDSSNYTPNSPIVNITEAQASAAIAACPSNVSQVCCCLYMLQFKGKQGTKETSLMHNFCDIRASMCNMWGLLCWAARRPSALGT